MNRQLHGQTVVTPAGARDPTRDTTQGALVPTVSQHRMLNVLEREQGTAWSTRGMPSTEHARRTSVPGKKQRPPRALLQGPRGWQFLISEVPLYSRTMPVALWWS